MASLRIFIVLFALASSAWAAPPFDGTIFLDPDIINATDPSTYVKVVDKGQGIRMMFDRRTNRFGDYNAYLFEARFRDLPSIEVQVNPEFSRGKARRLAAKYALVIGKLPRCLRVDVETVWIHDGVEPFGGGNNNLLIHTGQSAFYERDGILEETFVHEASHTSLDAAHSAALGWKSAQESDPDFISTYARDNPKREDIAETFLLWLAVRYRPERIDKSLRDTIRSTVPARLKYFSGLGFDVRPVR